ncbi:hypothetical protein HY30_06395 [Hyphomonas chukchiensis]|uniref:Uncharacterized protein n=1 Tax=Hyphomonas chukchiensis TaxID=1280947 RepID=A0A062UGC3_9PROT|nr:hypothetical protein HY30_06395 [Hyphomonas chukchiensis]
MGGLSGQGNAGVRGDYARITEGLRRPRGGQGAGFPTGMGAGVDCSPEDVGPQQKKT